MSCTAKTVALTTSSIKMKSRLSNPSSKRITGLLFNIRVEKIDKIKTKESNKKKDIAAKLNNSSAQMLGGDASNEDIQGAVLLTRDTSKAQQETFEESEEMADEAKSLYAMALVPYLSSVAKTAALAEPIANFMNASQNQLKSIRNPMEIRKLKGTLETGLFIGKNVPRLIVNLGKSSVGLLTFARKNGLDTSAADEIELDIEME